MIDLNPNEGIKLKTTNNNGLKNRIISSNHIDVIQKCLSDVLLLNFKMIQNFRSNFEVYKYKYRTQVRIYGV